VKINQSRIEKINEVDLKEGQFTAYWMQSAQRFAYNPAFEYAVNRANKLNQPLFIFFLIDKDYPEAEFGHYEFMFDGLKELKKTAAKKGLNFYIFEYSSTDIFGNLLENASLLVSEKVYLNNLQKWKEAAADTLEIPFYIVESNLVCPVEVVSDKEEYAAYTIRKKINKVLENYLKEYQAAEIINKDESILEMLDFNTRDQIIEDLDLYLTKLSFDEKISYKKYFRGGHTEAKKRLDDFIDNKLEDYDDKRNIPHLEYQSNLSPYLHFGQISPIEAALAAKRSSENAEGFLEELIVRRELSYNFVYYNDSYSGSLKDILPDWAYKTLEEHSQDQREYEYGFEEFANYQTHDPYWNAAQKELKITGKMHNYMRMYWGKKILQWSADPEKAYQYALRLNNKYGLDGRDANSYAGVSWCFGKHDRAWKEREIFGKVRYMNANGLERKFDMEKYLEKIDNLN